MADDKQIIIGSEETGEVLSVMYGTGVKGSPDTQQKSTNTFSGSVVQGNKNVPYTLEIDKLRFEGMEQHQALSEKLDKMLAEPDNITVIDTVYPKGQAPYQVKDIYFGCLVSDNSYDLKTDDNTAESLKFGCTGRKREWKKLNE